MGDSILTDSIQKLKAVSPLPVQFKLIKNGKIIDVLNDAYTYEFDPKSEKGNYRLEARLKFSEEWIPWIYTNPIYISN